MECPKCGGRGATIDDSPRSLDDWLNAESVRVICTGLDKSKPGTGHAPGHEFQECNQTYKLKIKVLGIEPI